jgi:hypothetical protein
LQTGFYPVTRVKTDYTNRVIKKKKKKTHENQQNAERLNCATALTASTNVVSSTHGDIPILSTSPNSTPIA